VKYIELFAGCGGLSLGLKSVGYELVIANELSPMAAESYAYNFFDENLQEQASLKSPKLKKTYWLSSQFPKSSLSSRLRENPYNFPALGSGYSDINPDSTNLKGSLIVGSIVDLNVWLEQNSKVTANLKAGFDGGGVDLVSGGPPCQSFSMAGLRKQDCAKNSLPWEFAKFAKTINPKIALLENVTGILRPFKDENGKEYYAWFELAKAFAAIGYVPLCLHVNAKFAGVPQNRPRFILMGVRKDFFDQLSQTFNASEKSLFSQPLNFYNLTKHDHDVDLSSLKYFDVSKQDDFKLFKDSFLAPLVAHSESLVSVFDAIDDLRLNGSLSSKFAQSTFNVFQKTLNKRAMKNHDLRSNNELVKRRFRIYQVLQKVTRSTQKQVSSVMKGDSDSISTDSWKELANFDYLIESGKLIKFKLKKDFVEYLKGHKTKKQTQKALIANQPAPAALSIPDDACHYEELRTLTVREMARIQSFPDNFEFRSKVTTGGKMRSFEVPQYTQVGNAVPPLLGRALGLAISNLLSRQLTNHLDQSPKVSKIEFEAA